uniref:gamma-glutamylcyclotransferase n=1 Tax=Arion vulgaris TaxID=1028688 RepID=A0A0B7B3N7_9EUPU
MQLVLGMTDYWLGATATIRSGSPEDYVCGVIWTLDIKDLEALDIQEIFYHPIDVDVKSEQGEIIKCRTYEMDKTLLTDTKPSPHYKKVVIAGARQNKLPEEYIQFLESFPDNGITRTPPLYQKVIDTVKKVRGQVKNERGPNDELHVLDMLES